MNKPNSLLIGIFLSISGSILFGHIIEASPVNPSVFKRDDSIGFENDDFKGQLPVENREEQARLPNTDLGQDDRVGIELDELEEGKRKEPVEGYVGDEPLRGDLMEGKEAVRSHSALVDDLLPSSIQEGVGNNAEANTSYSRLTDANHQDGSKTELAHGQQVLIEAESRHVPDNQEQHTVSVPGQDIQDSHKAPLVLHDSTQQPLVLQDQQGTKQNHDQASNQQPLVNQGLNQPLEQQGSNQQLPLQQGSDQQLPFQQSSNQHPHLQGSDQQLPLQQGSNQQVPLQHGSDQSAQTQYASNQKLPLQHGSDQQLPLQHGSDQQLPLQHGSDQQLPLQHGSDQQLPFQHGSDPQLPLQRGSDQRDTNLNQNQGLSKSQNAVTNSYLNQNQKSYLQQVLQNNVQSESLQTDGTKQSGNDVPEEFKVEDNQPLDGSSEPAAQPKDHYSDDGYLDPPANNLDTDRSLSDKGDEDMGHNANLYDEDGEADTRLNNKNIIDDNNEQAVYNGDNDGSDREADNDNDEKDQGVVGVDEDYDDYSYEDKDEKDGFEGHEETKRTTTSSTPTKDDWYGDSNEEDGDDGVDGILDKEDEDYSDPDIDQELEFQQTHHMKPHTDSKGEEFFNDNMKTNFKEGLVENKLLKNRVGLNAPSSMVLFYTWIILIVLIAVVSLSAFRYRCKGMIMNGRNFRNGNHGNYRHERPGEENKRLLENVYT